MAFPVPECRVCPLVDSGLDSRVRFRSFDSLVLSDLFYHEAQPPGQGVQLGFVQGQVCPAGEVFLSAGRPEQSRVQGFLPQGIHHFMRDAWTL